MIENFQAAVIKTKDEALEQYKSEIEDFYDRENQREKQELYEKGLANSEQATKSSKQTEDLER